MLALRKKNLLVDSENLFTAYKVAEGKLLVRGTLPCCANFLAKCLESGEGLESIKGNFAAILQSDALGTIAMVDHLCTYPLFFTNSKISPIYHDLLSEAEGTNELVRKMLFLFGGHSIGSQTGNKGILRISPFEYLRSGNLHSYDNNSFYSHENIHETEKLKSVVEAVVLRNVADHNILLLSGGRDSVTIAGILKKLGVLSRFEIVHVYSGMYPQSEVNQVRAIAAEMGLEVNFLRYDFNLESDDSLSARQKCFWQDAPFLAKKNALQTLVRPGTKIWTGELGDQLFGGPKDEIFLRCLNQVDHFDEKAMAKLWIAQACSRGAFEGLNAAPEHSALENDSALVLAEEEVTNQIISILKRVRSSSWLERWMRVNLLLKGPFRLWAYSQDDWNWYAPFGDRAIIEEALKISVECKVGAQGATRWIYRRLWGDVISLVPWQNPKSGLKIFELEQYR